MRRHDFSYAKDLFFAETICDASKKFPQKNGCFAQKTYPLRKEHVASIKVSSVGRFFVLFLALFLSLKVKGGYFLDFYFKFS